MVVSQDIMKGLKTSSSAVKLNTRKQKLKHRFEIIRKLGEGTCGKVQLGLNRETGQQVAVKAIKKSKIQTDDDLTRIRREIQIMSSVRHPSIIHIFEVFENKDKIVLVMEYAAGGELYDYIVEKRGLLEPDARRIFRQIAAAVYYCHKHKICHRDLKLENVLMDENGNAKIADFGLSNIFDGKHKLTTYCGSPLYASPEVVKGVPYLGPEVDCWSLGVLLYTLVYGAMPFDGSNFKRLVKQITNGEYAEPAEKSEASDLIKGMLTASPSKRLTIEEICSHWWVNEGYDVSCLVVADELARQTPVRLDLLLALAPCPKSSKSLVIDEDSSLSLGLSDEEPPPLVPEGETTEVKKKKKKGKKKKETTQRTDAEEETSRTDEEKVSQTEEETPSEIEEPSVAEEIPEKEEELVAEEAKTPTPTVPTQQPNFSRFKSLEEDKRHETLLVPSKTAPGQFGKRLLFEEEVDEEDEESTATAKQEGEGEEEEEKTPVVDKSSLGSWPSVEEDPAPPSVPQKKTSMVVISLSAPKGAPALPMPSVAVQPSQEVSPGVKTIKSEIKFTVAPVGREEEGAFGGGTVTDDRASVLARQLGVMKEPGPDAMPEHRSSNENERATGPGDQLQPPTRRLAALQHSPREFIIPIALEEGGYLPTPTSSVTSVNSLSSEEATGVQRPFFSSTSLDEGRRVVGSSSSLMGRMRRMINEGEESVENTVHSPRYRRYGSAWSGSALDGSEAAGMSAFQKRKPPVARYKITIQKSGSVSSTDDDDDDDDFNLLSADSLFNSMLSRAKDASRNFRQQQQCEQPQAQQQPQPAQQSTPTRRQPEVDEDEWFHRPMSSFFSSTASASPFSASRTSMTNLGGRMGSLFDTGSPMSSVSQRARSLMSSVWDDSEWSEFFRS